MRSESGRRQKSSVKRGGALFLCVLLLVSCSKLLGLQGGTVQAACTTDAQCAPGYSCLERLGCRNRCTADSDCGAGARCFKAFVTTACIPVTEGCEFSDSDSGTSDGCPQGTSCNGNVCRTLCDSADQCPGGQVCLSGGCVSTDPSHENASGVGATSGGMSGGGAAGGPDLVGGSSGSPDEVAGTGGVLAAAGSGGSTGTATTGAVGTLGQACAVKGARACAGHAQRGQLVCSGGAWASNGTCALGTDCDTSTGNVGLCHPIVAECAEASPGTNFCRNAESFQCGPDLVTATSVETCPFVCTAGACQECVPATKDCGGGGDAGAGLVPRVCQSDGTWLDGTPCTFLCAAATGRCVAATCGDGARNGDETDTDCGGSCGATCSAGKRCGLNTDCVLPTSGKCTGGKCASATCGDGVKNGNETDMDCGGSCGATCAVGKSCGTSNDCDSSACVSGVCQGLCAPNAGKCVGNGVQTCDTTGEWGPTIACAAGTERCGSGACTGCAAGTANCDSNAADCETNLNSTTTCGTTCANMAACSNANASGSTCPVGKCTFTCTAGFADCDGVGSNGCETNLSSTSTCGTSCANDVACSPNNVAAATCGSGSCAYTTCSSGYSDCDGNKADGCETCGACAGGAVCDALSAASCVNAGCTDQWAGWAVPNSAADVAAGAPNAESYTDNGNGTVTDNVTHLMWQQTGPSGTYTQSGASAYCATLSLAGHTDWRLPSTIEFISILDYGQSVSTVSKTYFPSTSGAYWSSTPDNTQSPEVWFVDFNGYVNPSLVTQMLHAQCVR